MKYCIYYVSIHMFFLCSENEFLQFYGSIMETVVRILLYWTLALVEVVNGLTCVGHLKVVLSYTLYVYTQSIY